MANHRMPNELIAFPTKDKNWKDQWYQGRDLLDFPNFRMVICGPPNSGKSTIVKNVLVRSEPYDQIIVIHPGGGEEYDYLFEGLPEDSEAVQIRDHFPTKEEWIELTEPRTPGGKPPRTMAICDDIEYKSGMSKEQKRDLSYLCRYISSHRRVNCIFISQNFHLFDPVIRRNANVFVLFKGTDLTDMKLVWTKIGVRSRAVQNIFDTHLDKPHDSFWLDLTKNSPMKYRVNGFTPIDPKNL